MADLAEEKTQQLLRKIVREETADMKSNLRAIVREETADLRSETAGLRDDIKTIKQVQGQQSITLRTMQSDLGSLKTSFRAQAKEMHKLGVLFEDLDHRFEAGNELY